LASDVTYDRQGKAFRHEIKTSSKGGSNATVVACLDAAHDLKDVITQVAGVTSVS